jgi:hypothetical protein
MATVDRLKLGNYESSLFSITEATQNLSKNEG